MEITDDVLKFSTREELITIIHNLQQENDKAHQEIEDLKNEILEQTEYD